MTEVSDADLLERWRAGDSRAGNELATRYFMALRAYFLNKASVDYEDLVQESFTRLASQRERFRGDSSFRTFVFGVARMILLEYLRTKKRAGRFDPMEHSIADVEGGRLSSLMAEKEHHRLVLEALRGLPVADQELLELYYWQELTAREISKIQGQLEATVRSRIRAALGRTRQLYAEQVRRPRSSDEVVEVDDAKIEDWLVELRSVFAGMDMQLPR